LTWKCVNAVSCSINGVYQAVSNPNFASSTFQPSATTNYSLLCAGPGGWGTASSSVLVTVASSGIIEINP
jgi:hypothetical protein